MTKKTAFVSGASGFIGVNLVKQLCLAGWEVTALHRASSDLAYLSRFPARRVIGDITDPGTLDAVIPTGVDAVAAAAGSIIWRRVMVAPNPTQDSLLATLDNRLVEL